MTHTERKDNNEEEEEDGEASARTYEQAAVGASVDGELRRRGVALLDEVLGGALEVGEAVLLVGQHPGCTAGTEHLRQ